MCRKMTLTTGFASCYSSRLECLRSTSCVVHRAAHALRGFSPELVRSAAVERNVKQQSQPDIALRI